MTVRRALIGPAVLILMASFIGGCASYDYLQRTDRVSYRTGNAVNANLERETINPSSGSMYDTSGLGGNGSVIPPDSQNGTTGSPTPGTPSINTPPPP